MAAAGSNAYLLCGSPGNEKRLQHSTRAVHPQNAHGRLVYVLVDFGKDVLVNAAEVFNSKVAHVRVVNHGSYYATVGRFTYAVGSVIHQFPAGTGSQALAHESLREMLSESPTEGFSIRIARYRDEERIQRQGMRKEEERAFPEGHNIAVPVGGEHFGWHGRKT